MRFAPRSRVVFIGKSPIDRVEFGMSGTVITSYPITMSYDVEFDDGKVAAISEIQLGVPGGACNEGYRLNKNHVWAAALLHNDISEFLERYDWKLQDDEALGVDYNRWIHKRHKNKVPFATLDALKDQIEKNVLERQLRHAMID